MAGLLSLTLIIMTVINTIIMIVIIINITEEINGGGVISRFFNILERQL
jgi:hypothetical protein